MTTSSATASTPTSHARAVARSAPSRRLWIALLLALAVLSLEVTGGLLTGSLALLSDAGHVAVDVVALLVGLGAARLAAREPDAAHTYGFHRLESIGALANAVLLVAAAAVIVAESIGRLLTPVEINASAVLGVAVGGFAVNGASALIVHGAERKTEATRVLVLHLGGDAVGALAVIGSALVIMAGGPTTADAVASLVIAAVLGVAGIRLLGRIVHVLSEGVPAALSLPIVSATLQAIPGVSGVHDLHVWALAEDLPVVTAHLETSPGPDRHRLLPAATEELRRIGVGHATLQVEDEPCGQGRPAATVGPAQPPSIYPADEPTATRSPSPQRSDLP